MRIQFAWIAAVTLLSAGMVAAGDTPSTAPATAPDPGIKGISQKNKDDACAFQVGKDGIIVTITSASGIGDMTFQCTGKKWPVKVTVILQYAGDKPYTKLEGFTATMASKNPTRGSAPLAATVKGGMATIDADLSKEPADENMTLILSWVDFYR